MKKIFILLFVLLSLTGCKNDNSQKNTEFTKLSVNDTQSQNIVQEKPPVETDVNSYSTTVQDKSPGRVNNLQIGCQAINRICN